MPWIDNAKQLLVSISPDLIVRPHKTMRSKSNASDEVKLLYV